MLRIKKVVYIPQPKKTKQQSPPAAAKAKKKQLPPLADWGVGAGGEAVEVYTDKAAGRRQQIAMREVNWRSAHSRAALEPGYPPEYWYSKLLGPKTKRDPMPQTLTEFLARLPFMEGAYSLLATPDPDKAVLEQIEGDDDEGGGDGNNTTRPDTDTDTDTGTTVGVAAPALTPWPFTLLPAPAPVVTWVIPPTCAIVNKYRFARQYETPGYPITYWCNVLDIPRVTLQQATARGAFQAYKHESSGSWIIPPSDMLTNYSRQHHKLTRNTTSGYGRAGVPVYRPSPDPEKPHVIQKMCKGCLARDVPEWHDLGTRFWHRQARKMDGYYSSCKACRNLKRIEQTLI